MEGIPQQGNQESVRVRTEAERREAAEQALTAIENFEHVQPEVFVSHGREYPITNAIDLMVATAQMTKDHIDQVHAKAVERSDYRAEEFLAKLREYEEVYEDLLARQAELRQAYPNAIERINALTPAISDMEKSMNELLSEYLSMRAQ